MFQASRIETVKFFGAAIWSEDQLGPRTMVRNQAENLDGCQNSTNRVAAAVGVNNEASRNFIGVAC
jgi:hypothetical protein